MSICRVSCSHINNLLIILFPPWWVIQLYINRTSGLLCDYSTTYSNLLVYFTLEMCCNSLGLQFKFFVYCIIPCVFQIVVFLNLASDYFIVSIIGFG